MRIIYCLGLLLLGSSWVSAQDGCEAVAEIKPFCGLQAPEDLVITGDGKALLMSEFGGLPTVKTGGIVRFDLETERVERLYPLAGADGEPNWGDRRCPGAPAKALSAHGIHLSQRSDGHWQLLVVNHGGRESIEFFELRASQQLTWRGCVVMPEGAYLNDVTGLADGGFYTSHMMDKNDPQAVAKALSGAISGHIFEWHPGQPVTVMANSQMSLPNGLQISADGKALFVNVYNLGEVRKIDLASGKVLATAKVARPDNSNWSDDGRLLVASHTGEFDYEKDSECRRVDAGYCPMAFEIVAVDPDTMVTETIFAHQGAPMGAATAAIKVGGYLYMGSFAGNRLIKAPLKSQP